MSIKRFQMPAYVPAEKAHEYTGRLSRHRVAYVPAGYTAEDVIAGRIPQEDASEASLPTTINETGRKPRGKRKAQ